MSTLIVGVGQVTLLFRHARSLKDKRHVMRSLMQKLRNHGFSVTECSEHDEVRQGILGFSYVGAHGGAVQQALDEAMRLFIGDFEVLGTNQDLFDYSGDDLEKMISPEEDKYLGD